MMEKSSPPRILWKGAINFGLVHVPVALYPAVKSQDIDFDWIDKRDMKPVGYKRINKHTGKEVLKDDIVRGYQYEAGRYVVLSDAEIRGAHAKGTQSIDILAFVDLAQLSFLYLDSPYYLAPGPRGEKVYALLREALQRSKKVGIAHVIIQTKQHLAALVPVGSLLVLNTLRWGNEIKPVETLNLPENSLKASGIKDKELSMAVQLIEDMTEKWDPDQYVNTFHDEIMTLVKRKIKAGNTEVVSESEPADTEPKASNVIDLTDLLKRSLRSGKSDSGRSRAGVAAESAADAKAAAPKTARKPKRA